MQISRQQLYRELVDFAGYPFLKQDGLRFAQVKATHPETLMAGRYVTVDVECLKSSFPQRAVRVSG